VIWFLLLGLFIGASLGAMILAIFTARSCEDAFEEGRVYERLNRCTCWPDQDWSDGCPLHPRPFTPWPKESNARLGR
jgi:hypothetical protein